MRLTSAAEGDGKSRHVSISASAVRAANAAVALFSTVQNAVVAHYNGVINAGPFSARLDVRERQSIEFV
jgi:hypothetical protein